MSKVIEINSGTFRSEVLESSVPVLVDAYSPSCPPCRAAVPVLEELAEEVRDKAKVVKLNAVEEVYLAVALRVNAFPTFIVFKDGTEVARIVGLRSKERLKEALL